MQNLNQPRALYVLFFTEMWECFSYYGMRMLLVLYMYEQLSMTEANSIGVYALYTSLVELGSIAGGYIADKYFGARNSIFFGGTLIALGHIVLSIFADHQTTLLLSLAFIIVGSSFFKTNIRVLLGQFYGENDSRRGPGFSLFYVGINIGSLLATALCGNVAAYFGWNTGFGLAAIGMFSGLFVLFVKKDTLENKGIAPKSTSVLQQITIVVISLAIIPAVAFFFTKQHIVVPLLPIIAVATIMFIALRAANYSQAEKKNMCKLLLLIAALIVFFSFEELMGSMMIIFMDRYVDKKLCGFSLHSSTLTMSNPLTIIILGPLISRVISINIKTNIAIAFSLLALGFFTLYIGVFFSEEGNYIPMVYLLGCFAFIGLGELFIAPTVVSYCTEIAPKGLSGMLMGGVMMGHAYSSLLSGIIAQAIVVPSGEVDSLVQYQLFFMHVTIISAMIACCISSSIFFQKYKPQVAA